MPDLDTAARVRALLRDGVTAEDVDGYLDVLGPERVRQTPAQKVMGSDVLPRIYERFWRPVMFFGFTLRNQRDEARQKLRLLDIQPGDVVLDIACGPGNTTRQLRKEVGAQGLLIGVDSAATMLAQAVAESDDQIGYVRADAADLPFADASVDVVACYGALYLMDDPFAAVAEMVRVLKPDGRLAVLTTCARGPGPVRGLAVAASKWAVLRLFDRDEVTDALRRLGMVDVQQYVTAVSQVVAARR